MDGEGGKNRPPLRRREFVRFRVQQNVIAFVQVEDRAPAVHLMWEEEGMRSRCSTPSRWGLALLMLASTLTAWSGAAQPTPAIRAEGQLVVVDWPATAGEEGAAWWQDAALLPYLDRLEIGYRFARTAEAPTLDLTVAWSPADRGLIDGREVTVERWPDGLRLDVLEVTARVLRDSVHVADVILYLDSLDLAPRPEALSFAAAGLAWGTVFADVSADSAEAIFRDSFTLADPYILSLGFYEAGVELEAPRRERVIVYERYPTRVRGGVNIGIGWHIGRRPPRYVDDRARRDAATRDRTDDERVERDRDARPPADASRPPRDRDETSTRGDDSERERTRPRGSRRGSDDDEEDEDDEETLLPAAIAGAAAVGVLAVAGGTVGYYGHMGLTPVGLAAGYAEARGGILLYAGVNGATLERARDETERLTVGLLGFADLFRSPLQPAIGFGVLAQQANNDTDVAPLVTLGVVLNTGPVLLMAGADVTRGDLQVGLVYNFRAPRPRR